MAEDRMIGRIGSMVPENLGAVAVVGLFAVAFALFAGNAAFFQAGDHPRPIWTPVGGETAATVEEGAQPRLPVRRVQTRQIVEPVAQAPTARAGDRADEAVSQAAISQLQRSLARLGLYDGAIDGIAGPMTRQAVARFEADNGRPVTGRIDPAIAATIRAAAELAGSAPVPQPKPVSSAPVKTVEIVRTRDPQAPQTTAAPTPGFDPMLVTRVQIGLINYGARAVEIDGMMGEQTAAAIRDFERHFELEVTGVPSAALVRKLEDIGALTSG